MCRIAICVKRKMTKEEFGDAWWSNKDGMGFAFVKEDKVHTFKGLMKEKEAWDKYSKMDVPTPHILHFRRISSGIVCPELTHPFLVDKNSPSFVEHIGGEPVLFHNGTITGWKNMAAISWAFDGEVPEGDWSDARFMAHSISKIKEDKQREKFLIEIGSGDKFAVLSTKGITMVGDWAEQDDIYYSDLYVYRKGY